MHHRKKKWITQAFTFSTVSMLACPSLLAANGPNTKQVGYRASTSSLQSIVQKVEAKSNRQQLIFEPGATKPFSSGPILFGSHIKQKLQVSDNINGYSIRSGGIGYLADKELKDSISIPLDSFELGAGISYAKSHADILVNDKLHTNSGQILGFGTAVKNDYFLHVLLAGAKSQHKSKRSIPNTTQEAHGEFRSGQFFSKARIGYLARQGDWQITPEASIQFTHVRQRGYNETDAGNSNLSVSDTSGHGTIAGAGGRLLYIQPKTWTEIRAFYLRNLKDIVIMPNATFLSTGATFTPSAQNNAKNILNLGAGFHYQLKQDIFLIGNYDFQAKAKGYREHVASLTVRFHY